MDEATGARIWRLESQLGTGGFGIVSVWRNSVTDEKIALKKFRTDIPLTSKHREQWRQEVDIMLRLNHENVIRCMKTPSEFIVETDDELPILCMEYCSGGDLRQSLNRSINSCGLIESEILAIISDLTSALGYLHNRRIIHRDLKPENIVIKETEARVVYKLIDLGYAKELEQNSLAVSFVGTLQYIAPELFMEKEYTKSVDYWSLGLITHEIITGQRPFLHNQSPGQWMLVVENKDPNVICVSQVDEEGPKEFRETFFPETWIGESLETDITLWLRTLLEWNPELRGRTHHEITVFKDLERILQAKRIKVVFSEKSNFKLELQNGHFGRDLSLWIEQKLGVKPEDQIILNSNGTGQIGDNDDLSSINFVFVFSKAKKDIDKRIRDFELRIPESIKPFLTKPKQEVTPEVKKLIYRHGFYFTRQEKKIWKENCCQSIKAFVSFLSNKFRFVQAKNLSMNKTFEKILAKFELFQESCYHDMEKYREQSQQKERIVSAKTFDSWINSDKNLHSAVMSLKNQLCNFELKKINAEILTSLDDKSMDEFVNKAQRSFEGLKRIPVSGRKEKDTVLDMAIIVAKCLKQRDKNLRDYFSRLSKLTAIFDEISEASLKLSALELNLESLEIAISKAQRKRQSDVWKLLAAALKTGTKDGPPQPSPQSSLSPIAINNSSFRNAIIENQMFRANIQRLMDESSETVNQYRLGVQLEF